MPEPRLVDVTHASVAAGYLTKMKRLPAEPLTFQAGSTYSTPRSEKKNSPVPAKVGWQPPPPPPPTLTSPPQSNALNLAL